MEQKGCHQEQVLELLNQQLHSDFTFSKDGILGSMCSMPHPLAVDVFQEHFEKNLGDPGLFPGAAAIEKELIEILSDLMGAPEPAGVVLSGGTEANIVAMWAAKRQARPNQRKVLLSEAAHFSFEKAAGFMDLDLVKLPVNESHQLSVEAVKAAYDDQVMAIVGIAGTTGLGVIDDIEALSAFAIEKGVYLHVDAAFGGFVIPFLEEAGYPGARFNFELPGVSSITLDPHKMGRCVIPTGTLLFRSQEIKHLVSTPVSYLAGGQTTHNSLVGTRSGACSLAAWAVMKHLGREGFVRELTHCMQLTEFLIDSIEKQPGFSLLIRPVMNIVGLRSETLSPIELATHLRKAGWAVALFPEHVRIVVMPHVSRKAIEGFVETLERIASDSPKDL